MRKYTKIISLISLLAMLIALNPVLAKDNKTQNPLPEQAGVYDVPNHPELKVRVFVHRAKPGPTPSPTLTCNIADTDSAAVVGPAGWRLPTNFSYYLNTSSVPSSVGGGNWAIITQNSFNAWTSWSTGHTATYLGTTSINRAVRDNKNIISWGRASNSALAITYTWYNQTTSLAVETDTIMNQNYAWRWSNPATWAQPTGYTCAFTSSYDAQDILTHELGHWFGLNDHYTENYANNTMYGYGSQMETKKNTLSGGDVAGLKNIYN